MARQKGKYEVILMFVTVFPYQSVKSLSSAPIAMFFTSGTTGNAKMVEHSQASMGLGGTEMRR